MRRTLLLSTLGILAALGASAQTADPDSKTVSEPEFAGVVFRLDAGKLIPLERQSTANIRTTTSGFMVVHAKSVWVFAGAKSSVRFGKEALEFVARASAEIDPAMIYHLRKLDSRKKTREMTLATARGTPFGASATNQTDDALPVTFARYGSSSIKITVTILPPGEYAIQATPSQAVFCFGVD
jgi:hypothetical protein